MQDNLMTVKEASAFLHVHVQTLYRWQQDSLQQAGLGEVAGRSGETRFGIGRTPFF